MAHTVIIQNAIPVHYDPRVKVMPCEPARIPYLPLDILYQIAKALPQPKQVFNLALASKDTWEYLQPALYECETTYEARLTHVYGGESSTSLHRYHGKYSRQGASRTDQALEENGPKCQGHGLSGECNEGKDRIGLEDRVFDLDFPKGQFQIDGAMTALHWASMQGASGLPVALKAIRSAIAHQPSYIDGVNLKVRYYGRGWDLDSDPVDLPPPLFLAVAHGNTAVVEALIDAGCDLDLFQGKSFCPGWVHQNKKEKMLTSYKIHRECEQAKQTPGSCVCEWWAPLVNLSESNPCQTVGHVAIELGRTEMLEMLLRRGLNAQQGLFPLIHYAVLKGNVAAVKALLDHDPNLIHSRRRDMTVLHTATFMKQEFLAEDIRNGKLKDMISCLLEHGADLEARTEIWQNFLGRTYGGLTPLKFALDFVVNAELENHALISLHAAEVFISMGAVWNQQFYSEMFNGRILDFCVRKTVWLMDTQRFSLLGSYDDYIPHRFLYRRIRKAFGRIVKIIIEKATECLSQDDSQALFSEAFSGLTKYYARNDIGPFAAQAVGRLLLSTGITPTDEEMRRWKELLPQNDSETSRESDDETSYWIEKSDDEMSCWSEDEAWAEGDGEVSAGNNDEASDKSDDEASLNNDDDLSDADDLWRSEDRRAEDGGERNWAFLVSGLDDEGWRSDVDES